MARAEGPVLIADIASARLAETDALDLSGLTERHHFELPRSLSLGSSADVIDTLNGVVRGSVVLFLSYGLPGRIHRKLASKLTRRGVAVYFYWPRENAIEIVDRHRISSYTNHALFVRALNVLRKAAAVRPRPIKLPRVRRRRAQIRETQTYVAKLSATRIPGTANQRRLEAARRILGEERIRDRRMPTRGDPVAGTGAYVRLDYWAKLESGGSYGHTCFLAKAAALVTRDFECIFANRYDLLDALDVRQKIIAHDNPSASSSELIRYGNQLEAPVAAALNGLRPAYVYERSVLGSVAAAKWCLETDTPYIVEYNGSELAMARSFGTPYELEDELEAAEDFSLRVASLINVISHPVADDLIERGIPAEKILVNPNAVDPATYRPKEGRERAAKREKLRLEVDDIVVGFCGTFGGWHGVEVLAAAMPQICRADPRIRFLLIGDGNLKHLVHKAVADHNIWNQVVDLGLVPQIAGAEALSICDIVVSPHAQNIDGKTFFGSPTKLFEYMAVGAAIVASDLAQLGEVMRPSLSVADVNNNSTITGARGVLVQPSSVEELVEAVIGLAANADLRNALSSNARQAAIEHYTWDIHVENIWRALAGLPLKGYANDCGAATSAAAN